MDKPPTVEEMMRAIRMVLDASHEDGTDYSDQETCARIDWEFLEKLDREAEDGGV